MVFNAIARRPAGPLDEIAARLWAMPSPKGSPAPLPTDGVAYTVAHLPGMVVSTEDAVTWIRRGRRVQIGGDADGRAALVAQVTRPRPVVRWLGGKSWATPELVEQFAQGGPYEVVGEPFGGGMAFTLALCANGFKPGVRFMVGDRNRRLIAAYDAIRDDPAAVWAAMRRWPVDKATYIRVRDHVQPQGGVEAAAQFLWLNRTSFNGMHRGDGAGNVPWGDKTSLGITLERLEDFARALAGVELIAADARVILSHIELAGAKAFAYCDPPFWWAAGVKRGFTEYGVGAFGIADHIELARQIDWCVTRGAGVTYSNAQTAETVGLADAMGLTPRVAWPRRPGAARGSRKPTPELLAASTWHPVRPDYHLPCTFGDSASEAAALAGLLRFARAQRMLNGTEADYPLVARAAEGPALDRIVAIARGAGLLSAVEDGGASICLRRSSGALHVELGEHAIRRGDRRVSFSSDSGLVHAVSAELLVGPIAEPPRLRPRFIDRLLDGHVDVEQLGQHDRALVDRLGLTADAAPASWLRDQLQRHLEAPDVTGLSTPAAAAALVTPGGRYLAIDGVALRHVDVDALERWLIWLHARARDRGRRINLGLSRLGRVVDPGEDVRQAFYRPTQWPVLFDRHRRSAERRSVSLSANAPWRSRGPLRGRYPAVARLWLCGWSLNELAAATDQHRSAVDRLIRSARRAAHESDLVLRVDGAQVVEGAP